MRTPHALSGVDGPDHAPETRREPGPFQLHAQPGRSASSPRSSRLLGACWPSDSQQVDVSCVATIQTEMGSNAARARRVVTHSRRVGSSLLERGSTQGVESGEAKQVGRSRQGFRGGDRGPGDPVGRSGLRRWHGQSDGEPDRIRQPVGGYQSVGLAERSGLARRDADVVADREPNPHCHSQTSWQIRPDRVVAP
jgi:hypothetical protein